MDHMGPGQHPDAAAELVQRVGQAAAILGTLAEAGARLAVEERRRRVQRAEQREVEAEQRDKLRRHADRLADHAARQRAAHDRRVIAQAVDSDWVEDAGLLDLAEVWRTARVREQQFPEARQAAEAVEQRLREMYPHPMDLYDQAVRDGVPRAQAMRTAAAEMARTPVMRPHPGGRRAGALLPAEEPAVMDEAFAAALADEQIRLATGVDPREYLTELRRLGPGGEAAAEALREALATRAGRELAQGAVDAATPDDPTTSTVDEHAAVGMPRNAADIDAANRDTATSARSAPQLAGQWYPEGINTPAPPVHAAGRRPATAAPVPGRKPGRAR